MTRIYSFFIAICLLAACGVDGEPQQPAAQEGQQGVPVSGTATVGMSVGQSGVRGYGALGVQGGPISLIFGY